MQDFLEIGQIVNTFGVKGMVKVVPFTENVERFAELKSVFLEKNNKMEEKEIEETKYHKNMILVKFKKIETIEDAEKYVNAYLKVDRENAIELEDDEYFIADMIGMDVLTEDGEIFGSLKDVIETGANDVYIINSKKHGEVLIPAIKECILDVNVKEGRMLVHLMEGLID